MSVDDDDDVELGACEIVNESGLDDELPLEFVEKISDGEFDSLTTAVLLTGTTTRAV